MYIYSYEKYFIYINNYPPMQKTIEKITDLSIYKMLSDNIRLRIMKLLMERERNVSDIINAFSIDQPLISHKLRELRENGLVVSYRSGRNIIYKISSESLINIIKITENTGNKLDKTCNCAECIE